jgi:hypothetical protein
VIHPIQELTEQTLSEQLRQATQEKLTMNNAIIFSIAMLGLTANAAMVKSVMANISMGTFKARCAAAGGSVTQSGTGRKCRLPSGATVTCHEIDGPGIACDYRVAIAGSKVPELLGTPQSIDPSTGTKTPRAESGGNTVGGNNTQGGGKGDTAAGADSGPDSMGNGDGGPAVK